MEEHLLAKEAEENSVHQTTTQEEMMEENKNGIRAIHQKEEVALTIELDLLVEIAVLEVLEVVEEVEELTTTETSSQDLASVVEEAQEEEVDNLSYHNTKTRPISRACFFIF